MTANAEETRSWRGLAAAGAVAAVVTLAASAPASLYSAFLDFSRSGVAYAGIEGTIWKGEVRRLSVGRTPVGDVSYRLSPLSLLTLSPKITLEAKDGAVDGGGTAVLRPGGGFSLAGVKADIALEAVAPMGLFGEPARGVARVDISRLDFSPAKGCAAAAGSLWTNVLDAPSRRYGMPPLPMSGALACEEGDLKIAVAGENQSAGAEVTLRIDRKFAYELAASVRLSKDDMASAFRMFGFEGDDGRLTYGSAGVLRSAGS